MMQLRPYQTRAIDQLYKWFELNKSGHPAISMPGGSGKSVVIAQIVKDAVQNWPGTRILMLVHSKELVAQNAAKLRQLWPDAPLGIYSASIGERNVNIITYAGIQTVRNRANEIGKIDLCIVDECHAISHKDTGGYRKLLSDLFLINPDMRIVGFSASPFRLGHGMINTGKDALFTDILEPVTIEELVAKNYLSPLTSKAPKFLYDLSGLHKRQGDYIASEMQAKFNTSNNNINVVQELIEFAKNRKHWLIFCSGVEHSEAIARLLNEYNISATSLTATASKAEREQKLADFESGKIKAMCNVGILTTGYDFVDLDCIVFLRATQSPGLYLQCAVRGMRIAPNKKDCLVLDFAGVVRTHGPITNIQIQVKETKGNGEAPVKVCDNCFELCHISAKVCPACNTPFPEPEPKKLKLHNDDIMGLRGIEMDVTGWIWKEHISRASGKRMLRVDYYGALSDPPVTEYLTITHDGWAGAKAIRTLGEIANNSKAVISNDLYSIIYSMNQSKPPNLIEYKKNGKYNQITKRIWND